MSGPYNRPPRQHMNAESPLSPRETKNRWCSFLHTVSFTTFTETEKAPVKYKLPFRFFTTSPAGTQSSPPSPTHRPSPHWMSVTTGNHSPPKEATPLVSTNTIAVCRVKTRSIRQAANRRRGGKRLAARVKTRRPGLTQLFLDHIIRYRRRYWLHHNPRTSFIGVLSTHFSVDSISIIASSASARGQA